MSALEKQANQLGQQASQECERLAKDRTLMMQMLQKVGIETRPQRKPGNAWRSSELCSALIPQEKERLSALEKRYQTLTGGKSFPKSSNAMREVSEGVPQHAWPQTAALGADLLIIT